ncbi:MAG: ATP synthase F0 subunit B [Desulfobacteraceae bacterium]|nr:ATP synthase F0 subunit B [Desulfobacteraceae bacterium]
MINVDGSLFIQMVNFVVLIWALNFVLYRPIRGILAQRREKVEGLEQGIATYEKDLSEKEQAIQDGIKQAREKGQKEKEELEEHAREQERQMMEQINEKARSDMAEIRERVGREVESVRKSLQPQVDQFADQISEKILGRAL